MGGMIHRFLRVAGCGIAGPDEMAFSQRRNAEKRAIDRSTS